MTSPTVRIELLPLGQTLDVPRGELLQDVLFAQGVEFPCGGRGRCKGCRIKVLEGTLPITGEDTRLLKPAELEAGWRLACRARPESDLRIELAQWEAAILTDTTTFGFVPQDGLGVAVDLGTTTVVAQLLDLRTGDVLGVRLGLNVQARHGADIMSRIDFAMAGAGQAELTRLIREQIGGFIEELLATARGHPGELKRIVLVGNTVMHHLFCGIPVTPLSHYPFEPEQDGLQEFTPAALGWQVPGQPVVRFLPCLGGFVGSDILAGILAVGQHNAPGLVILLDLGTNGEIVVGNRDRLLCASTAAGPAFEGARISTGMRAATGAISEVHLEDGALRCHVLGNVEPRGVCGSGLVDAVACALELGWVASSGRLTRPDAIPLAGTVELTQADLRELQLAKGAIAAGLRILLRQWGAEPGQVERVYLAGAFGNYVNRTSARRIGLIGFPREKVQPVGNTALLGAKLALFSPSGTLGYPETLPDQVRHVTLSDDPSFQDIFAEEMRFPAGVGERSSQL